MDIGPLELLIVLAIVLLLFGATKLPSLARGMGQAVSEFKKELAARLTTRLRTRGRAPTRRNNQTDAHDVDDD